MDSLKFESINLETCELNPEKDAEKETLHLRKDIKEASYGEPQ
jgi:hypothetical protein